MAETRTINLEVKDNAEASAKDFQKLADNIEKLTESISSLNKESEKTSESIEDISKSSKGAESGIRKIGRGIKGIGLAFKAAGVGLIITAFSLLKDVFTQNQKVADALSSVFETISIVFNEVTRVVTEVYDAVSEATGGFDALGKVMGGLLTLIIAPFKAGFFGIKLAVEEVQLAWETSFFGDNDPTTISNLRDRIKETKNDLLDVGKAVVQAGGDIVTNFVEAVGEVGNMVTETAKGISDISIKAAFEQAKLNVEVTNRAKIAAAQQGLLIEQYDRAAEKLRQVRDEERNSIDERIKANNDLNEVLNKQEEALLKQADLQIQAARNEVKKSNNIENQIALTEALANREGVLAQVEGLRSEQLANDLALNREKLELTQSLSESETNLANEQKRFEAERIEDEDKRLERLKEVVQEEKDIELERLKIKIDSYKEGTQARLDAQIEYNETKQQLDQELATLEEEQNKRSLDNTKALQEQKFNAVSSTLSAINNLSELFAGKSSKQQERAFKVQKAVNIASAVIDTYKAANLALASAPPPLSFAFAGAAITAGLLNVKNIASQKFDSASASGGRGSAPSIGGSTPQSIQPSFNVVGDSGVNQLEALKSQPSKAYVVSGEVSSAQALDRNRQRNATL
jgi:hypothetical protein